MNKYRVKTTITTHTILFEYEVDSKNIIDKIIEWFILKEPKYKYELVETNIQGNMIHETYLKVKRKIPRVLEGNGWIENCKITKVEEVYNIELELEEYEND